MSKENSINNIIVVGDRVLIKPSKEKNKTKTGLYLPPGYSSQEPVLSGYIIKIGPGYPIPKTEEDEAWKSVSKSDSIRYIPLQVKEGDLAVFVQKSAFEVVIDDEKYFIVPQHSILIVHREVF